MYQYHLRPPFPLDLDVATEIWSKKLHRVLWSFDSFVRHYWQTLWHTHFQERLLPSNFFDNECFRVENPNLSEATLDCRESWPWCDTGPKVLVLALLAHYISPNVKYLTQKMWRWKNSINVHCHIFHLSCWDVNCSLSWYVTSKKTGYSKAGSGVKSTVSLRVRIQ